MIACWTLWADHDSASCPAADEAHQAVLKVQAAAEGAPAGTHAGQPQWLTLEAAEGIPEAS